MRSYKLILFICEKLTIKELNDASVCISMCVTNAAIFANVLTIGDVSQFYTFASSRWALGPLLKEYFLRSFPSTYTYFSHAKHIWTTQSSYIHKFYSFYHRELTQHHSYSKLENMIFECIHNEFCHINFSYTLTCSMFESSSILIYFHDFSNVLFRLSLPMSQAQNWIRKK